MGQHEIQTMNPRHYVILDLALAGNGPKEIAQALEMTPQAISLITHAPIFQHELERRRAKVEAQVDAELVEGPSHARAILESSAAAAARVHVDLLMAEDPKVRQGSANAILDRVFGDEKKGSGTRVVVLGNDAIELLRLALAESPGERKEVIQGDCEVEVGLPCGERVEDPRREAEEARRAVQDPSPGGEPLEASRVLQASEEVKGD